jgi:hypothetical protein
VVARAPIDWSHRVDQILTRWNKLGRPEAVREGVTAMTTALTDWSTARNRLIAAVEAIEKALREKEISE